MPDKSAMEQLWSPNGNDLYNPQTFAGHFAAAGPGFGAMESYYNHLSPQASPSVELQQRNDISKFERQLVFDREREKQARELAQQQFSLQNRAFDLQKQQAEWKRGLVGNAIGSMEKLYGGNSAPTLERAPQVQIGPVFSEEQMAQQQNMVRDRSMRQAAGVGQRMQGQYAAKGYGGNSPLLKAIQANLETQGRVGGETGALQFAGQMATENAKNLLGGQQLQLQGHDSYQQNLINRYAAQQSGNNALLAALSGMVGSV